MKLPFRYPVVYFYSDDYEDSETIFKTGYIEPINTDAEPYEATVTAEGLKCYNKVVTGVANKI